MNNRISDLTEQLQDHIEESINILERIELCRSQLQGYKDSMDEILTMLICNRNSQNSDLSKFQSVSFWGSDSESARKELDDPQWKRIREKGEKSIDKGRQRLEEYMESRFLLIQILQSQIREDDRVSNKDAVRKLYDELEGLSLKYNIRHDMIFKYADYLNRISLYDECISKSERLLKLCEIYEDNENLHDRACILLGDAYKAVGKYEESFDYLDRVLNKDYDRTSKIRLHAIVSKLGGMILTHDMKSFGPLLATIPKSVLQETYEDPDMTMIQARIYHDQGVYYSSNSEFKTAIDSYENAIRLYKSLSEKYEKDSLKAAEIFGVSPEAVSVPDIDTYIGLMHTFFTLEDMYGLTIDKIDDTVCLHLDKNISKPGGQLWDMLDDWYVMKDKLTHGRITQEEYDNWRYNFSMKDSSSIHASAPSEVLTDTKKKPKGKK